MKVGVFVDQPRHFVEEAVRLAGLDAIQLHGRENPADYNMGTLVLKAVRIGARFDPTKLKSLPARVLPLLDAADRTHKGGTGRTVDWNAAAAASAVRPVVLAGGLRPDNVREAIRVVRPFGLDVCSGVETAPGRKNTDLIRAFLDAVRAEAGDVSRGFWS
jgi:phosphoribosylanthranilate isomerase